MYDLKKKLCIGHNKELFIVRRRHVTRVATPKGDCSARMMLSMTLKIATQYRGAYKVQSSLTIYAY